MNNAVYIRYLLQTTLNVGGVTGGAFPVAKRLSIEYHTNARYDDELGIATWVMDTNGSGVFRGYRLKADEKGNRALAAHDVSHGVDSSGRSRPGSGRSIAQSVAVVLRCMHAG